MPCRCNSLILRSALERNHTECKGHLHGFFTLRVDSTHRICDCTQGSDTSCIRVRCDQTRCYGVSCLVTHMTGKSALLCAQYLGRAPRFSQIHTLHIKSLVSPFLAQPPCFQILIIFLLCLDSSIISQDNPALTTHIHKLSHKEYSSALCETTECVVIPFRLN